MQKMNYLETYAMEEISKFGDFPGVTCCCGDGISNSHYIVFS